MTYRNRKITARATNDYDDKNIQMSEMKNLLKCCLFWNFVSFCALFLCFFFYLSSSIPTLGGFEIRAKVCSICFGLLIASAFRFETILIFVFICLIHYNAKTKQINLGTLKQCQSRMNKTPSLRNILCYAKWFFIFGLSISVGVKMMNVIVLWLHICTAAI